MLNEFLKVAYAQHTQKQEQAELVDLMKQLPMAELHKIASGEKVAYLGPCSPDGGNQSWVEQFKGTPFMEQAIGLEQELLQAEMANQQRNQVESQRSSQGYAQMDQIRLKKRLLEIQKAKGEMGTLAQAGMAVSGNLPGGQGPDQGEGAPAGTDMAGMPAKEAAARMRLRKQAMLVAPVGRALAQSDMTKAAHQTELHSVGDRAGRLLAKSAGIGEAVIRIAKNNPGAVIGGGLGVLHGLTKEDGGVGSALVEGAGGAAAGHAIQGIGGRMMGDKPKTFGRALKGYGNQLSNEGKMLRKGLDDLPQASDKAMERLARKQGRPAPVAQVAAPTAEMAVSG